MIDEFKTISDTIGEGYYTEKRSKFLAFAHHVTTVDEVKEIVAGYRKKYYDARHCCYAYMLGPERTEFRANDDVVIRYFGGVKLGTSGLIVAYREAAIDALAHCEEVTQQIEEIVTYDFTYPMMNDVMRIVKDMNPRILDQTFDNTCSIKLSIRKSEAEQLRSRLKKLSFE